MGKIVCSNCREIQIIESRSKFKLVIGFAEKGQKIVQITEVRINEIIVFSKFYESLTQGTILSSLSKSILRNTLGLR